MLLPPGYPIKYQEEFLSWQQMLPAEHFDIFFHLTGASSGGLDTFIFFFKNRVAVYPSPWRIFIHNLDPHACDVLVLHTCREGITDQQGRRRWDPCFVMTQKMLCSKHTELWISCVGAACS